jgi:hypothetical protein
MTKITTILNGFVNINLETDENKFSKISKEKDNEILKSNIEISNLKSGFIERTIAIDLQPPVSLSKIAEEIGINGSSIQFASVQGSNVYGVESQNSDWDITVVSTDLIGYRFSEFSFEGIDYDVNIYSPEEFQNRIDRKYMKELEILSYPEEAFLIKTLDFQTENNRTQLINKVREESDELWFRAKNNLKIKKDDYQALKTIWHSIRFLIFAEQILKFGSIEKLSAANVLRDPIVNSKRVDFEFFEENFGALREQMKLELGRHISEDNSEKREIQTEPSNTIERRYVTANFQGFYIQKGSGLPNVEARYIRRNTIESVEDNTWRMFIRFGDYIEQNWRTFNPPNTDRISPECKEGCITGYVIGGKDNFQNNSKIFFGKNPDTKEYGDLRLRIKNIGSYPCQIKGKTIAVGDSITLNVNALEYKLKLPTNDVLVSAGEFYNGNPLTVNTLTECNYEFTFEVDYDGLNFQLRNSDNTISTNKEFSLGAHRFSNSYNSANADLKVNYYNLTTELSNVWPYWESNFVWPETSPYCMAAGTLSIPDPKYPTDSRSLQNIMVDGIMFLHQSLYNQNNLDATTKTQYNRFSFLPSGQTASSSGCTSVDIQYPYGDFAPQLQTSSIPFLVL